MFEHLIFYDAGCPLCRKFVAYLIAKDIDQRFCFADLASETAKEILIGAYEKLLKANSVILVENYPSTGRHFWIRSQAVFRIYSFLPGWRKYLGVLIHFPIRIGDFLYRYLAEHRHQFHLDYPMKPGPEERFLP